MPPWLIVTSGWPGPLAVAIGAAARAEDHHLEPVAAVVVMAAALTFGCGSLLRRHRDRRARRAAVG